MLNSHSITTMTIVLLFYVFVSLSHPHFQVTNDNCKCQCMAGSLVRAQVVDLLLLFPLIHTSQPTNIYSYNETSSEIYRTTTTTELTSRQMKNLNQTTNAILLLSKSKHVSQSIENEQCLQLLNHVNELQLPWSCRIFLVLSVTSESRTQEFKRKKM